MSEVSTILTSLDAAWDELVPARSSESGDFAIIQKLNVGLICRTPDACASYVLPLGNATHVNKHARNYVLWSATQANFIFDSKTSTSDALVLKCLNHELSGTFAYLIFDIENRISTLNGNDRQTTMQAVVTEWSTLFSPAQKISYEKLLGLWGELWFLNKFENIQESIPYWTGPEGETSDFLTPVHSIELKVGFNHLRHHLSHDQLTSRRPESASYLVSLTVSQNETGKKPVDLIRSILDELKDPALFIRKLTVLGYGPEHWNDDFYPLEIAEGPDWFLLKDIPKIRDFDIGISNIRYEVQLDPNLRLNQKSLPTEFKKQTQSNR